MAVMFKKNSFVFVVLFTLIYEVSKKLCNGSMLNMQIGDNNIFDFDVKPGGVLQEHEESWEGVTCKFTYACQGGTKELWSLEIIKSTDASEYICSVKRPSGVSYLFFERFELQLFGVSSEEAVVIGENGSHLMSTEYIHRPEENKVVYDEDFRSHLTKVELYGKVRRHEL